MKKDRPPRRQHTKPAATRGDKLAWDGAHYLVLQADAGHIPLRDNCVSLVIATPPYIGTRPSRPGDYCTADPAIHQRWMARFLAEATRIVKPQRHIALISNRPPRGRRRGARLIVFQVLRKRRRRARWGPERVRSVRFRTRYMDAKGFPYWALPRKLYRELLERYSRPGETIAHVFAGSGNGGIAALAAGRRPILIDLHYLKQIRRRLDRQVR
jgi:hypothetical protein